MRPGIGRSVHAFALLAASSLAPAQSPERPITLRYACTDGAESLPIVRQVCRDFEKAHPGIKIKIEPVVDNYAQKLMAMYAARVSPDVARFGPTDFQPLAARKALLPLDPFIAKDAEVDLGEYYANTVRFMSYDGSLYVLPRSVAPTGLIFYNKRLLDEAGLPYPDGTWTWSTRVRPELREKDFGWMIQRLTKRSGEGARAKTTQFGLGVAWPQLWFNTLLMSRGVTLWDSNENPTQITATDPRVTEVLNFASDSINKHRWIPSQIELTSNNTSVRDQFVQGKIALFQTGPWEVRKFRREMKDPWDVCLFPAHEGHSFQSAGEGNGTAIFASTRHPEAAWKFVKWMSGPPGQTAFAKAGQDQPAIRRLATQPGIWLPAADATGKDAVPANLGVTDAAAAGMRVNQVPEWFRPISEASQGIAFDILNGIRPPIQTLERYQRDATRDLANAKRRLQTTPYPFLPALGIAIALLAGLGWWVYGPERKQRYTLSERKENRSAYLFLVPWFLGLAMTFGPMVYSIFLSFAESDMIQTPKWVGLQNYQDAFFVDDSVPISIRQTFLYAFLSIPLGLVSALGLALLLNQRVRGVPLFRALYYLPSLASGVAMSLIWMRLFNPTEGLINQIIYGPDGDRNLLGIGDFLSRLGGTPDQPINWLGNTQTVIPAFVIMGMWGAGGGTIIFLAGLQGISPSYYEAATLDGAGIWRRFRNVTLPLLTPTVFFSLVTGVIGALQVFTQAVVMTDGGPDRATLFYMVHLYRVAFRDLKMGYASALAWILFVIILVITILQLRGAKRWVYYEGEAK